MRFPRLGAFAARTVLVVCAASAGVSAPARADADAHGGPRAGAAPAATTRAARRRPATPVVGLMADAGLPDGAVAALAIRPLPWLRLHGGVGTNTISAGVRGGLTLMLPSLVSPSLSVDVGHYPSGRSNDFVRRIVRLDPSLSDLFQRLGYTYANLHAGLEIGHRSVTFFVHAGVTYGRAVLEDAGPALEERANDDGGRTTIQINQDPIVRVLTPSVKLGLVVYLR